MGLKGRNHKKTWEKKVYSILVAKPFKGGDQSGILQMSELDRIRQLLVQGLAPSKVDIADESRLHRGHQGFIEGKITHVRLKISAEAFRGRSRLERHRMVHDLLQVVIDDGLHALAIETSVPDQE
jgi:BolA protein